MGVCLTLLAGKVILSVVCIGPSGVGDAGIVDGRVVDGEMYSSCEVEATDADKAGSDG